MLYALSRWWRDRQRLRISASIVCPHHTARAALLLVAVFIIAMVLYLGIVSATAEGQTMYVCTVEDALNVREGKGLHYDRVFWADRGDALDLIKIEGKYALVGRAGDFGWCPLEYLSDKPPVDKLPEDWLVVEND